MNNNINEDVLREILIRLPDCKSAIQCSTVCKRWFSVVHNAYFIDTFNTRRDDSDDNCMQFTFFVNHPTDRTKTYDLFFRTEKTDCLDFLPRPWTVLIRASCSGFLLLSLGDRNLCICNPLTRQWRLLPRAPENGFVASAYGLVLSPNTRGRIVDFNVVLMVCNFRSRCWIALRFCSETRSWTTESVAPIRHPIVSPAEPCNGVLYWREGLLSRCSGVLAHDPSSGAAEYVDLPGGGWFGQRGWIGPRVTDKLGTVRGRLRLAQTRWVRGVGTHALRVWELEDGRPREWRLVHEAWPRPRVPQSNALVIGFHPDGGAVFLEYRDADVFRYEFARDSVEKVSEFLSALGPFQPFPVAHPSSWPKLIPDLKRPEIRAERKKNRKKDLIPE